jgi:serine/threonine-protein kinase RsbT
MISKRTERIALVTEQDVVAARQLARRFTQEAGFGLVDQTKLVTATSELARNAVKYGGGGNLQCELLESDGRVGVRLTVTDDGPGIADIGLAMTDGYSTGNGLGLGLSGARRLVSTFDIRSAPGAGTRIVAERWR